ncbi:MAG: hypothetical protein GY859_23110, partial [Desulfobacterales bacterium]|nr:hypothetical protein [Desulfobacterales bacterium]
HADAVCITPDIGAAGLDGPITVQSSVTTRCAIAGAGPGGRACAMARVYTCNGHNL